MAGQMGRTRAAARAVAGLGNRRGATSSSSSATSADSACSTSAAARSGGWILSEWVGPEEGSSAPTSSPRWSRWRSHWSCPTCASSSTTCSRPSSSRPRSTSCNARFVLTPIGRHDEQLGIYTRLAKPGAVLGSKIQARRLAAPAGGRRRRSDRGVGWRSGRWRRLRHGPVPPELLRGRGIEPHVTARTYSRSGPEHPYCDVPLQFAESLRPRLRSCSATTCLSWSRQRGRRSTIPSAGGRRSWSSRRGGGPSARRGARRTVSTRPRGSRGSPGSRSRVWTPRACGDELPRTHRRGARRS